MIARPPALARSTLARIGRWARVSSTPVRTAALGDVRLEAGALLEACQITFRTVGHLDPSRSNAVLLIPWYQGTSAQLLPLVGAGRLIDPSRFFAILIDTLGNGRASSPSNSPSQPDAGFPVFTIADIVQTQHRVVTEVLTIPRLHAVVGISMGGMLAFEWMVAYPGVAKKGVSIVGTPRTQPVDQRRWEGRVASLQSTSKWGRVTRALLACRPRTAVVEARTDVTNHIRQAQAIVSHDIARRFAGSLEAAAAAVTAELLVVAAATDREVDPAPGFAFARMIDAETLELDGRCGHQAPICDQPRLWREVSAFLAR